MGSDLRQFFTVVIRGSTSDDPIGPPSKRRAPMTRKEPSRLPTVLFPGNTRRAGDFAIAATIGFDPFSHGLARFAP